MKVSGVVINAAVLLLTCLTAQWTVAAPAAESRRLDTVGPAL